MVRILGFADFGSSVFVKVLTSFRKAELRKVLLTPSSVLLDAFVSEAPHD